MSADVREITALDRHIEITPGTRGGRPRLAGRRITVADVVIMHLRMGQSLEEIAGTYDLPLASVYAAMTYYYDHQPEIDQSIRDDEAFAEASRAKNPSLLQALLRNRSELPPPARQYCTSALPRPVEAPVP